MSETNNATDRWSEADSEIFLDHSEVFVPGRAEQIASLLHLIPAQADEEFTVVELAAGGGVLARAILEKFPSCPYVGLDGSAGFRDYISATFASLCDRP